MLNLRKKLLVSIFTLMLALVAVSTTTYAWFTLGNVAEVSGIEMEVQGAEGLTIRVSKVNNVSGTNLGGANNWSIAHNLKDYPEIPAIKMKPLSMKNVWENTSVYDGSLYEIVDVEDDGSAEYKAEAAGIGTNTFIEITFDFRAESQVTVTFNDLAAGFTASYPSHTFITPIDVAAGLGTVTAVAAESPVTGARLANALRVAYKSGSTYTLINPDEYDQSVANQYGNWDGVALDFFNELSGKKELVAPTEYAYTTTAVNAIELVELQPEHDAAGEVAYYTGSVTLLIWLEGWDADCFNALAFDHATFTVKFGALAD